MKTHLTHIGTALFLTLTLTGCGDKGGGGGDGDSGDEPTLGEDGDAVKVTKDCETQWSEKVAAAPIGQVKAHDIVEVTTGSGSLNMDGTKHSQSREEILSATDEVIVTATRWEYFKPALGVVEGENRLTKENFMITCTPYDVGDDQADPEGLANAGVTILVDRQESIAVKAGTFDARYQKILVQSDLGLADEVLGDHWTIEDETVIVKEKTVVRQMVDDGASEMVSTTEKELIEYVAGG